MKQRAVAALAATWATLVAAEQPAAPPPPPSFAAPNLTPAGVRAMAANCAPCHGSDGRPAEGSSVAPLAGQTREAIVEKMNAFKEGTREATLMHQIAKGFSEAEIAALADYFSHQSR